MSGIDDREYMEWRERDQAERTAWKRQEERIEGNAWIRYEEAMKYWVRHGGKMPVNPDKP